MWWKLSNLFTKNNTKHKYNINDCVKKNIDFGEIIVTREYLKSLLIAWKKNKFSDEIFYNTICILHEYQLCIDWEENENNSVTSIVLAEFEMMDLNFRTKDDVDAYLEFLETPINKAEYGLRKLEQYTNSIETLKRSIKLRGTKPYLGSK